MTYPSDISPDIEAGAGGNKIQDPIEVPSPQTQEGSVLERLSAKWIAAFVIVALAISAAIAVWLTVYVVVSNDLTEQQDLDQLMRITDPLQSIATLMIGTIFGFAVQSGATAVSKQRADKNKTEADEQHRQALENGKRAKENAKVAATQAKTGHALLSAMKRMAQESGEQPPTFGAEMTRSPATSTYMHDALAAAENNLLAPEDFNHYLV